MLDISQVIVQNHKLLWYKKLEHFNEMLTQLTQNRVKHENPAPSACVRNLTNRTYANFVLYDVVHCSYWK